MTTLRCLVAMMLCLLMAATMSVPVLCAFPPMPPMRTPRPAATEAPHLPPRGMMSDCSASQEQAQEPTVPTMPFFPPTRPPRQANTAAPTPPPHDLPFGSPGSQARAHESITFANHGSGKYAPGVVVAAGGRDTSESGSAATAGTSPFDITASLQEIRDYFKNATSVPAPPTTPLEDAANASSSTSNLSDNTSDDITIPTTPGEESIFDLDSAAADKAVLPSPTPKTPTKTDPQSAFKSTAMVSKLCDAAFFAITIFVVAFH